MTETLESGLGPDEQRPGGEEMDAADRGVWERDTRRVPEPDGQLAARLGLLASPSHAAFDRVTRMLRERTGAPMALLLMDELVLSHEGLPDTIAEVGHASLPAQLPQRVADAEEVEQGERFLAVPVRCEGRRAAVLCAVTGSPRQWSADDLAAAQDLAEFAGGELDRRAAIVDRERAEGALRDSEEHILRAFDVASIGMVILDARAASAGRILHVNRAACEYFGRSPGELAGMHIMDLTHPDDHELTEDALRRLFGGEIRDLRLEKRYVHALGHTLWAELTCSSVLAHDERAPYSITLVEDITERKQAELDLPAIANVLRRILSGEDARETIVQAALEVAGASSAHLAERIDDTTLSVTASAGLNLVGVDIRLDAPSATANVFLEGEPLFLADPGENPLASPQLVEMASARSIMWQPILSHSGVIGVLCVCWSERVADVSARAARAVALLTDETAMALAHRDALQRLAVQATTDPLTGLPNRRAWDDLVEREMALAARRRHPLTLALLDMDRFKRFNDTRGHHAGDELLGEFAARARSVLREGDALARWGGEEFAVLLPDCPSHGFAASILDRIRSVVPAGQSCSVGYASWDGVESPEELIERADRALYRAKAMGRDRAVCADAPPAAREGGGAALERASPLGPRAERTRAPST
ncbi:MAG TPA: diguanylate cyclase [Solirubrobacteraceae bacterium]|nr:diguanylate cyclase [Solirubrobacteraceae bacterium]